MIIGGSTYYMAYGSSWTCSLLNDVDSNGRWDPGETIRVDVQLNDSLSRGDYEAVFTLYNGVECRLQFSL